MFQWSVLASKTTLSVRGRFVGSQVQVKGSASIIAISASQEEKPSTRVNGPEPHGPGASIAHQCPSPVPYLRYPNPSSSQNRVLAMWNPRNLASASPSGSGNSKRTV